MFHAFNLAEFRSEMSDFLPVGICVIDRKFIVHHWNQRLAEWTEVTAEEILGCKLSDVFPELQRPSFLMRVEDAFRSGCPVTFSAAIHRHLLRAKSTFGAGGLMCQDTTLLPLHEHPDHALLVVTDVTQRVQESNALRAERKKLKEVADNLQRQTEALQEAERQAQAANKAKSEFLANVSHEIRTPMTAILGFADVLNDFDVSMAERANAVGTIRSNGEHLLQLINDILDISKIEAGRLEMEMAPCHLPTLLDDLRKLFTHRAQQRGIGFDIKSSPGTPTVFDSDPLRLKQVLINLLSNAMKFTDKGSVELHVGLDVTRDNNASMRFEVVDTGIGMSDEQLSRLFQAFVQVDSSAARRFGGTGLGLVISKRICQLLGGDIKVTSQVNVGTRFRAQLPVDPQRLQLQATPVTHDPVTAPKVTTTAGTALAGLRVLVAEDGLDNQKLIGFRLKKEGADFRIVGDGAAAVVAVNEANENGQPYDIVLMDMQMPVLDGYHAAGQLRAEGQTLPIIALTAHAMASDRQECLDAGCSDYHTKPINWPELRALILSNVAAARSLAETDSTVTVT